MQLSLRASSKETDTALADRNDPTLPAILEFQAPSTAIVNAPVPRFARSIALLISSMVVASLTALAVIQVDRVVVATGKVVSEAATVVVQPLDTSIVRSIDVKPGDLVKAGQVLARLDPTFAAADLTALQAQVGSLQAQVSRLQAEADNRPFTYTGLDPSLTLQAATYAQRKAEYDFKIENYQQKMNSLSATIARARSDAEGYRDRLQYAKSLETMRRELERLNVGSKINTLAAMDTRAEMQRNLDSALQAASSSQRDLAALIAERNAYEQNWRVDISEKLSEATSKLSDAREALNKAQLRRELVELKAETDGVVLSVSKASVGSVLTAGQQLISLVPTDAPLEVEANIPGNTDGFVQVGDPVTIKFDTFNYTQYGLAYGTVRMVSPDSFTMMDEQRNPTGAITPSIPSGSAAVWFRSRISIDKVALKNVPPNFRLMPGMPITADIKIGKRSVLRYLLGRIAPLTTEGMREP
ncbi:MAG: HlyD family type I secretion periplasmic adaptor subunit [Acetobacteraceae bacterium]